MKFKPRRIGDLAPFQRNHPFYENQIRTEGWVPFVVCDSIAAYWDGFTVRDKNERVYTAISVAAKEQIINMILAGYFGESVKDAHLDPNRWQHIYDDLIDVPRLDVIARDSLRIFELTDLGTTAAGTAVALDSDEPVTAARATTGPRPSSWVGVVERDADRSSFTYALQFGDREVWKIGHATDVRRRLTEVNTHVPYEVLGEQWRLVYHHQWPTEADAYQMEQRVLEALRTPGSIGERLACPRQELESVWKQSLLPKS